MGNYVTKEKVRVDPAPSKFFIQRILVKCSRINRTVNPFRSFQTWIHDFFSIMCLIGVLN